jgi:peptidyl-prolyl cis-trans isomerase D
MLQKLREKTTGWVAGIIVGILIIPFAFLGINDYFSARVQNWVAKVGDREISQQAFRDRLEQERAAQRRQQGESFDSREFENPLVKRQILDRMIDEELLLAAADRAGIVAADALVRREITRVPAFQVDGEFNPDQYRLVLNMQGLSAPGFDAMVRRDLTVAAVPQQIASTAVVSAKEVESLLQLGNQTRDLKLLDVPPPADDSAPSEEELLAWYEANKNAFLTDEKVSVEYVELKGSDLPADGIIDDASLRARYEENRARFVEPEERLTSHILIAFDKDADEAAVADARARAEVLVAKVRADGADFAALARESSDDVGSKSAGGDLGWMAKGGAFPAFDDALFALAAGEVSDPVRGEDGFHLILAREIKAGSEMPFEQVRDELLLEAQQTERERRFSEASGRLMDSVIRDPNSLSAAAADLGLSVSRAGPMTRAGGEGLAGNPAIIRAAFSPDLLSGAASDPIDLGPEHIAVIRVIEHVAAEPKPFADVRADAEGSVRLLRAQTAGEAKAAALLERARNGESFEQLATDAGGTVTMANKVTRNASSPAPSVVEKAFALPHPSDDSPSMGMAELGGGRFALLQVLAVTAGAVGELPQVQLDMLRQQVAGSRGEVETRAFISALRKQFPVQVAEERL